MHLRMCAYATMQQLRCHENYCKLSWVVYKPCAGCCLPHTHLLSRRSGRPTTPRSRKQSKSMLVHDTVVVLSDKHHPITHVGAGPIQLVYGLHSRLTTDLISTKFQFHNFFWRAFQRKNVQGRRYHQPAASRWLFQDVPQLSTFQAYTLLGQTQNFGTKKIAPWLIRMGCRLWDSMTDPLLGTVHLQIFYDFCGLACILMISSPNKQTSITFTKHVALSGGDFVCLYVKP